MGNTLTTNTNDKRINDSLLGKEIKDILSNKQQIIDVDKNGKNIIVPVNKYRACCLGVYKEAKNLSKGDFISVKMPSISSKEDPQCRGNDNCMVSDTLGLQIAGDPGWCKSQNKDLYPGLGGQCDKFMVDHCAKHLYQRGCIVCEKRKPTDKTCVPKWNSSNKNCFNRDPNEPTLTFGPEECSCINSATGFTLNSDPTNKFKGGIEFKNKFQNPYGVAGTKTNHYTKYSLNLFNYSIGQQKPQVLDTNCSASIRSKGSSQSGISRPYLLTDYANSNISMCLNQINIGNSQIGNLNFKNIKQNNNCGSGTARPPIEKTPKEKEQEQEEALKAKAEKDCKDKGYKSCLDMKNKLEQKAEEEEKKKNDKCAKDGKDINLSVKDCEELKAAHKKCKSEGHNDCTDKYQKMKAAEAKAAAADKKAAADKIATDSIQSESIDDEGIVVKKKASVIKKDPVKKTTSIETEETEETKDSTNKYLMYGGIALAVIIVIVLIILFAFPKQE